MPAYHSTFLGQSERTVGNIMLLPLRTSYRGPSYPTNDEYDIAEETLDLFRANSFFKNFDIKDPADRLLIYGILFVSDCLSRLTPRTTYREAIRVLNNLALDSFLLPGDVGFPMNALYQAPGSKSEAELLRGYLQQFRQELADRLLKRVYADDENVPSKHWLAFTRRRFMNRSL